MKRTAKIIVGTLFGLIGLVLIGLVVAAFLLRGRVDGLVRAELDRQLDATVDFSELDVSLLRSFPMLSVELRDVTVVGRGVFEGEPLFTAESLGAGADVFTLLRGERVEVQSVSAEHPVLSLKVTPEGKANYDIVKTDDDAPTQEPTEVDFRIDHYEIIDGKVSYMAPGVHVVVGRLSHDGSVDVTGSAQQWRSSTVADQVTTTLSGVTYLNEARVDVAVKAKVDTATQALELEEARLVLNELPVEAKGTARSSAEGVHLDLQFSAPDQTPLKSFVSALPNAYRADFRGLQASGVFSLRGWVKGLLGHEDGELPGFEVDVKLANGRLKYPDLPLPITGLALNAMIIHPGGPLNNLKLNVSRYAFQAGQSQASGRLMLATPFTQPRIELKLDGKLNLAEIAKAYPLPDVEALSGVFVVDVELSTLGDEIKRLTGNVAAEGAVLQRRGLPDVVVKKVKASFSPESTQLEELSATTGQSDITVRGTVSPVTALLSPDKKVTGTLSVVANKLLLADFSGQDSDQSASKGGGPAIPDNVSLKVRADVKELIYDDVTLSNVKGDLEMENQRLTLKGVQAKALGGALKIDGHVATPSDGDPTFDLDYKLENARFTDTFAALNSFQKLAPITKFLSGTFSTGMNMKGKLGEDMAPNLATLGGSGFMKAVDSTLADFKPLQMLSSALPVIPSKVDLRNVQTRFSVEDGAIKVREFPVTIKQVPLRISGSHGLDQDMSYVVTTQVPMKELEASSLAQKVKSLGLDLSKATKLDVTAKITGSITQPKLAFDVDAPNLAKTVEAAVVQKIEEETDKLKEKVSAQAEQLLNNARLRADQIRAEAKKAAAKVTSEGNAKADRIEKEGAGNPLKSFAAKQAAKTLRNETQKRASQLVEQADKRAEQVLREAQGQAERLR